LLYILLMEDEIRKRRALCWSWIKDVGELQDWKEIFLPEKEEELECFEEEVDSKMDGGESFDKI